MSIVAREVFTKHPEESRLYDADLSEDLVEGQLITGTPLVEEVTTEDLTISNISKTDSTVIFRIAGGVNGRAYSIKITANLTSPSDVWVGVAGLIVSNGY